MAGIGIAVIGTKGMGRGHLKAIGNVKGFELRAVCDVVPEEAAACAKEFNVPGYTNVKEMLAANPKIRAASIATPHWFHPPIAVECAKAGVHVLTEKPMSVTVAGADQMIRAHKKAKTILAVVFQHRFRAVNAAARKLVTSGQLGRINRVMLLAPGYRTNAYYASGAWRATWRGEGGGVLLNQAPHDLDLIQWIVGELPKEVYAINETVMHPIEVEDRASALIRYRNGATGYIHVSTTELPGGTAIEVAGDKGMLRIGGGKKAGAELAFARLKQDLRHFTRSTKEAWSRPKIEWVELKLPAEKLAGHTAVFDDFYRAIKSKRPPRVSGEDGRNSVELANAMILSSFGGKPVKFPVNRAAYEALMKKLVAGSKKRKS